LLLVVRAARHAGHTRVRRCRYGLGRHRTDADSRGDGGCDHANDREDQEQSEEQGADHPMKKFAYCSLDGKSFALLGLRFATLTDCYSEREAFIQEFVTNLRNGF
jgi:hypothetical protein